MICNKCGHPINKDDIYCRFCGNKIGEITKCVVCNSDILSDSQVCPVCGSKQSDYIKCDTCHEVNKSTNKYCTGCGKPLTSDAPLNETKETPAKTQSNFYVPIVVVACIIVGFIALIGSLIFSTIGSSIGSGLISSIQSSMRSVSLNRNDYPTDEIFFEEINNEEIFNEEINNDETITVQDEFKYNYYTLEFVDTVKVREQPSTDAKQVGKISKGSTKIGFSVCENEGYHWYQIGYNEWVANDGSFLYAYDFLSNENYVIEYHDSVKVNVTSDTGVYDGPGYNYNCTGWFIATSKFQIFESIQNEYGEYWLKISPCEYVPYSNVEYIYD